MPVFRVSAQMAAVAGYLAEISSLLDVYRYESEPGKSSLAHWEVI